MFKNLNAGAIGLRNRSLAETLELARLGGFAGIDFSIRGAAELDRRLGVAPNLALALDWAKAHRSVTLASSAKVVPSSPLARERSPQNECSGLLKGRREIPKLGVPPVQYLTFKAICLLGLGRYGEAWASLQSEVVDDEHSLRTGSARPGHRAVLC